MSTTDKLVFNLLDQHDMLGPIALEAADAIETLTRERDEARSRVNDIDLCRMAQAPCNALLDAETRIAELTRERDEARAALNSLLSYTEYALSEKAVELNRVARGDKP